MATVQHVSARELPTLGLSNPRWPLAHWSHEGRVARSLFWIITFSPSSVVSSVAWLDRVLMRDDGCDARRRYTFFWPCTRSHFPRSCITPQIVPFAIA